jgi:uncharacterized phage protein (TIGR02218 family)
MASGRSRTFIGHDMSLLRSCSTALAIALEGGVALWSADLFQFTLIDGVTNLYWSAWDGQGIAYAGNFYASQNPWLTRSKWSLANTMEVPSLDIALRAGNGEFNGGAQIKEQLHNGLFDGASMLLSRAYMTSPGSTAALGAIALFGGVVAGIAITGSKVTLTCKGKNNLLDQYAPRNVYGIGCSHNFCDANCTLNAASYTSGYTVGSGATAVFVPWPGTAPANYALYANGEIAFTSGPCSGQSRTIMNGNTSGLNLAYPLYEIPNAGDSFTALQGCDKTLNTCKNIYSNLQHRRAFDFVPPPDTTF